MKMQDAVDNEIAQAGAKRARRGTRFAAIGAMLVVAFLIGATAIVFAQLRQHEGQQRNVASPLPPTGSWVPVLQGYTISTLYAAHSASNMLYACATPAQQQSGTSGQPANGSPNYTVLRSTDFGSHWQDVGSKAALGVSCQLAINPTNGDDLFAAGLSSSNGKLSAFLKHSSDGGQTWRSIFPALQGTGTLPNTTWNIQELRISGNALFGTQWFTPAAIPNSHPGAMPRSYTRQSRLVRSTDGGQTWTVIDSQFASTNQEVSSYAVDSTSSQTIYALFGTPWWPIQPIQTEPGDLLPIYGINANLYKTTDGGAHWQMLLQSLPFGSQIHLAGDSPQLVYVGGRRGPLPYVGRSMPGTSNNVAYATGNFSLQRSSDGGTTWRAVADVPQAQASLVQNWFVDANGQVVIQASNVIQRYDAASNSWSTVTKPPVDDSLLAVTPSDSKSDVLWYEGTSNGRTELWRFVG